MVLAFAELIIGISEAELIARNQLRVVAALAELPVSKVQCGAVRIEYDVARSTSSMAAIATPATVPTAASRPAKATGAALLIGTGCANRSSSVSVVAFDAVRPRAPNTTATSSSAFTTFGTLQTVVTQAQCAANAEHSKAASTSSSASATLTAATTSATLASSPARGSASPMADRAALGRQRARFGIGRRAGRAIAIVVACLLHLLTAGAICLCPALLARSIAVVPVHAVVAPAFGLSGTPHCPSAITRHP